MSAAISPLQAAEGRGLPVVMTMLVEYAAYKINPRSHAASGPAPFLRQGKARKTDLKVGPLRGQGLLVRVTEVGRTRVR